MCISELDRGFLAGFLEGEACFWISELNGGRSYSCGVTVCARDDDQDLLEWLVALTGIGRLRRIRAQHTSRPQIGWTVDSQHDCTELARLVADSGFHGRRVAELGIWTSAVSVWTGIGGGDRRAALQALKRRLQTAKKYRCGAVSARPFAGGRRHTLGYISGLVCAEGSFQMTAGRPRFTMHLRHDERPLLDLLRSTTGFGVVRDYRPRAPLNPSSTWLVTAPDQLERFAAMLYDAGLPGRKGVELGVWELAVSELCSARRLGVRPRKELLRLASDRLRDARKYRPSTRPLLKLPGRDVRAAALAALKAWAAETDRPLACGAYSGWRRERPESPTRNTVAKEFGGWHAALDEAGLRDRAVRPPRSAAGEAGRRARRARQRSRVIEAVRLCEAELGRPPRAMEFFRWRSAVAPDSPAQSTVYRLFPDGWRAVLRALADEKGRCAGAPP